MHGQQNIKICIQLIKVLKREGKYKESSSTCHSCMV